MANFPPSTGRNRNRERLRDESASSSARGPSSFLYLRSSTQSALESVLPSRIGARTNQQHHHAPNSFPRWSPSSPASGVAGKWIDRLGIIQLSTSQRRPRENAVILSDGASGPFRQSERRDPRLHLQPADP